MIDRFFVDFVKLHACNWLTHVGKTKSSLLNIWIYACCRSILYVLVWFRKVTVKKGTLRYKYHYIEK